MPFLNFLLVLFLANVNSNYMLSPVRLSSVCLSYVTFMRPTHAVQIFDNISTALGIPWPCVDIYWKFHEDRPRETPPPGELNARGIAKYNDFGPIDGYISETVQDKRYVTIKH